jgi:type IV pilus assembly protein PilA
MKRMQKGFTLIELMIVVAIIGILAAVAIPQYQDYTVKAKLSKVQTYADPIKTAIGLYSQENGSFTGMGSGATVWATLGISGTPQATTEVTTISVASGVITLGISAIKTGVDGQTLTITPTSQTTNIVWGNTCAGISDAIFKKYFTC